MRLEGQPRYRGGDTARRSALLTSSQRQTVTSPASPLDREERQDCQYWTAGCASARGPWSSDVGVAIVYTCSRPPGSRPLPFGEIGGAIHIGDAADVPRHENPLDAGLHVGVEGGYISTEVGVESEVAAGEIGELHGGDEANGEADSVAGDFTGPGR